MNKLAKGAREMLSGNAKDVYMRSRAHVVAARYGNPGLSLKVIAVVGTNGKQTTASYLNELLQEAGHTTRLLLAEDDEPLGPVQVQSFLREAKKANARYAIVTLNSADIRCHSIDAAGLELVVATNISQTATETVEDQVEAIGQLLEEKPRYIILNHDDDYYAALADFEATAQKMTYGQHEQAEARMTEWHLYRKGSELRLVIDHQTTLELATHLIGTANLYNLAAATASVYIMGENIESIDEGAARLESIPFNYQYLKTEAPYDVVVDYAPNEVALTRLVASAKQLTKRRLIAVVQADTTSDECIELLSKDTARLIVIDINDFKRDKGTIERIVSPDAAIKLALRGARQDDIVILAGPLFTRHNDDGTPYAQAALTNFMQD